MDDGTINRYSNGKTMRSLLRIILAVLFLTVINSGIGLSEEDQDTAKKLKEAGDILPLETIVEKARQDYPGRILEVELKKKKKQLIYELELLDETGVVWELTYDAKTGELIRKKSDD
jgi:uncharacterized membrane protein YkoI